MGAGDEGKGSGYQADAYIKKQPVEDDGTDDGNNGGGNGGLGDGGPAPEDEIQDYTPLLIGGGVILLIALLS